MRLFSNYKLCDPKNRCIATFTVRPKHFLIPLFLLFAMMAVLADCAICSDGYAPQLGFTCTKCLGSASGLVLAAFVLVVIVFAAVAVASYVTSGERPGKQRGLVERFARFIPLQSLKIVIVSWQILTQVRAVHTKMPGE